MGSPSSQKFWTSPLCWISLPTPPPLKKWVPPSLPWSQSTYYQKLCLQNAFSVTQSWLIWKTSLKPYSLIQNSVQQGYLWKLYPLYPSSYREMPYPIMWNCCAHQRWTDSFPWTFLENPPRHDSPFLLGRLKLSVPRFEKGGSEKKECLGGLKKFLPQIVALGELNMFLLHTFVTECNSRKYWNNLFCLVYDNNSKEFYRVYLSHCKRKSVFFDDFEFNIIYFPANWKTYVIIFKVILRSTGTSTTWQFCAWFQSCTSTCSRFAIVKVSKSNYTFKIC